MKDIFILMAENPGLVFSYVGMFALMTWMYVDQRGAHKRAIEERNDAQQGEKDAIMLLASNQAKGLDHLSGIKHVMEQLLKSQDAQIDLLRKVRDEQLLTRSNNATEPGSGDQ